MWRDMTILLSSSFVFISVIVSSNAKVRQERYNFFGGTPLYFLPDAKESSSLYQ